MPKEPRHRGKGLARSAVCCPDAGSLGFVMTTRRSGATPPWDGIDSIKPERICQTLTSIQRARNPLPGPTGGECYNRRPFRAPQPNPVIFTLGINHHSAPLAIRERVAFGADKLPQALADLTRAGRFPEVGDPVDLQPHRNLLRSRGAGHGDRLAGPVPPARTRPRSTPTSTPTTSRKRSATPSASPAGSIRWCWASRRSSGR